MELLLIIFVLFILVGIINSITENSSGSKSSTTIAESASLKVRLLREPYHENGVTFSVLNVQTQGIITHISPIRPEFNLTMSDITHGTKGNGKPILTVIDQYQDIDSTKLKMTLRLEQVVQPGSGASDWFTLAGIPIEALVFPERGQRRIKATLSVKDQVTGRLASSAETTWNCDVQEGYLDEQTKESEAHAASLHLAMCIAGVDGKIDDDEVEVIKAWGSKSMNALEPDEQFERNQYLNQALQKATDELRRGNAHGLFENAAGILNNIDIPRYKYDAYELCLKVLKADGEAHPSEMANLTRLAKALLLDETKVRIMTDRNTINVKFTELGGNESEDDILGITPEMSKEEIRKHLNKLFKKHSARIGHDDSNVADKSRMWLEKIGEARVRHLG
jgi:uncharacterized tellurite resistance protein B-like protein